ncbi:hypothetical protein CO659_12580 [Rhizobium sp. S9]|nr:hypothetical protein CO659_12580 [Rhizobium sp. S9]
MIKWLKDILGINRYAVVWRIEYPDGHVMTGSDVIKYHGRSHSKSSATRIADDMCGLYGKDTHWIEAA